MGAQIIDSGTRIYDLGIRIIDTGARIYDVGAQNIDSGARIYYVGAQIIDARIYDMLFEKCLGRHSKAGVVGGLTP